MGLGGTSSLLILLTVLVSTRVNVTESRNPVKTFLSDVGDVIDCVDIYSQPAFAHPSLKNHSIQLTPSSYLEVLAKNTTIAPSVYQPWTEKGKCPKGTVPILRAPKNKSLISKTRGGVSNYKYSTNGHEYAVMYENVDNYGTQLNMNVWNPQVETDQMFSLAQLWLTNGPSDSINTIEAGWHVYPQLYGGYHQTRLFVYWTADGYQTTGCYNLYCSGFVQVSSSIAPGAVISPVSTYQGTQYYIGVLVFKDKGSGNWWLRVQNEWVGYWPSTLFTYLADKANNVEWGGEIYNNGQTNPHTTTQMGSGHLPSEGGDGISCGFTNVYYVDGSNVLQQPTSVGIITPSPGCYGINVVGDTGSSAGYTFYFGGPGLSSSCP